MSERHWHDLRDESFREELSRKLNFPAVKPHPDAPNQPAYFRAIEAAKAVVCTGPAGTGKTYIACGKAVELLRQGKVKRIVLTRPLKECGEEMGYLPGDLYAKVVDMMMPLIEALEEFTSPAEVERMRADGRLVIVPLEKMRGRTMKDAFVIFDEAQNATFAQLKMALTRFGSGTKMVVCGDYTQSDLPYRGHNSLWELVERFRRMRFWHHAVAHVELTKDDIVRDELVRWFVEATEGRFEASEQEGDGFEMVPCPNCDKDIWYEHWQDNGELIQCMHCDAHVDLRDEAGRLDPAVIEEPDEEDLMNCHYGRDACPLAAPR